MVKIDNGKAYKCYATYCSGLNGAGLMLSKEVEIK